MVARRQVYPFQRVAYIGTKGIVGYRIVPALPLTISSSHTSKCLKMSAFIDTGADISLFPSMIAKLLKHKLRSGKPQSFGTASGKGKAWRHTADISILTSDYRKVLCTISKVPIDFIQKRSDLPLLLGVEGFLERLVIMVDYPNQIVTVEVPSNVS